MFLIELAMTLPVFAQGVDYSITNYPTTTHTVWDEEGVPMVVTIDSLTMTLKGGSAGLNATFELKEVKGVAVDDYTSVHHFVVDYEPSSPIHIAVQLSKGDLEYMQFEGEGETYHFTFYTVMRN